MKTYKVFRCDDLPKDIRSAHYYSGSDLAEVENGTFVSLGELEDGEREIYKVEDVKAGTLVGVVGSVEFSYDERGYHGIETFKNDVGDVIRVLILEKGWRFSIGATDASTLEYTVGTPVTVGDVTLNVIAKEIVKNVTYFVFEVAKDEGTATA